MTTPPVPTEFEDSYSNFESYPTNLIYRTTYNSALEGYRSRLESISPTLCIKVEDIEFNGTPGYLDVGFRDFDTETGLKAANIQDPEDLKRRLGESLPNDPMTVIATGSMITPKDPNCRFIFIWAEHSRAPLNITKSLLVKILSYHQVMPNYLDFLSVFGKQSTHRELRFSGFRKQTFLQPGQGPSVPAVGRSGRCYQLCYNLKTVVNKSKDQKPQPELKDQEWSIRQAAFHHQFDVINGKTLWITTSGHDDIQNEVEDLTGRNARPEDISFGSPEQCFKATLAVHLLFCYWSTQGWRDYLRWLEDVVAQETDMVVLGSREIKLFRREYTSTHLQDIQYWEEQINDVAMVVEANNDVMATLRDFYTELKDDEHFTLKDSCRNDILSFSTQVTDLIMDLRMQAARARVLDQKIANRRNLVVQHLQSQAAEEMKSLAHQSQREAIAVRVIAVVTMIYLPATFVSTFFSTDIVKYQTNGVAGKGVFSWIAMQRWLEVSLPLTLVTMLFAAWWYYFADRTRKSLATQWTSVRLPLYRRGTKFG